MYSGEAQKFSIIKTRNLPPEANFGQEKNIYKSIRT